MFQNDDVNSTQENVQLSLENILNYMFGKGGNLKIKVILFILSQRKLLHPSS